ncbi:hypothetical protein AMECASPLE_025608 [Ameca splendens]|uniref:Uncharacterized protein n=1 Tax=Ameca splendens TaxID=208324 RepID=A0ABV1A169_9TELE
MASCHLELQPAPDGHWSPRQTPQGRGRSSVKYRSSSPQAKEAQVERVFPEALETFLLLCFNFLRPSGHATGPPSLCSSPVARLNSHCSQRICS